MAYALDIGRRSVIRKKPLKRSEQLEVREFAAQGMSHNAISTRTGFNRHSVKLYMLANGITPACVPFSGTYYRHGLPVTRVFRPRAAPTSETGGTLP